jgi:radical SAM superfamily enzyme with C-terminal helix-hairpin-helix motif
MKKKYLILDCFVDEPACFGVPPFMSPYPRYLFGALADAGTDTEKISYCTIDSLRIRDYRLDESFDMVFLIGGAVVPGKYLGSKIGTPVEVENIIKRNNHTRIAVGGLISHIINKAEFKNVTIIHYDIEKFAYHYAIGEPSDRWRDYEELKRWSVIGSPVVRLHPNYPHLICEIETYRGCPRKSHCSFCSESIFDEIRFRSENDILNEIDELIRNGISRFRIGRQADILQYKTGFRNYKNGFPQPDPQPVKNLFTALKERRMRGDIRTLNIDNANPGTISNFPDESSQILEAITESITPGDTIALGVESFDPEVIKKNNLKVKRDELIEVIKIINQIGGKRVDGIPLLLPGINLIHGLIGERMNTFKINYESLLHIKDMGLLVKRINIRKLLPFPGTFAFTAPQSIPEGVKKRYEYFRKKIRQEIDHYMLKEIYPAGTILREMLIQERRFDYSYAKQIASYSITAKIPIPLMMNSFIDAIVIDHRERSITALPYPIRINAIPQRAIESIKGIGRKSASQIILARPFKEKGDIAKISPHLDKWIFDGIAL